MISGELTNDARGLNAAAIGHVHIHQHQVGLKGFDGRDQRLRVGDRFAGNALLGEGAPDIGQRRGRVLDNEDFGGRFIVGLNQRQYAREQAGNILILHHRHIRAGAQQPHHGFQRFRHAQAKQLAGGVARTQRSQRRDFGVRIAIGRGNQQNGQWRDRVFGKVVPVMVDHTEAKKAELLGHAFDPLVGRIRNHPHHTSRLNLLGFARAGASSVIQ